MAEGQVLGANPLGGEKRSPWYDCGNRPLDVFAQDCAPPRQAETGCLAIQAIGSVPAPVNNNNMVMLSNGKQDTNSVRSWQCYSRVDVTGTVITRKNAMFILEDRLSSEERVADVDGDTVTPEIGRYAVRQMAPVDRSVIDENADGTEACHQCPGIVHP